MPKDESICFCPVFRTKLWKWAPAAPRAIYLKVSTSLKRMFVNCEHLFRSSLCEEVNNSSIPVDDMTFVFASV